MMNSELKTYICEVTALYLIFCSIKINRTKSLNHASSNANIGLCLPCSPSFDQMMELDEKSEDQSYYNYILYYIYYNIFWETL